jgi:hypothetical protein
MQGPRRSHRHELHDESGYPIPCEVDAGSGVRSGGPDIPLTAERHEQACVLPERSAQLKVA